VLKLGYVRHTAFMSEWVNMNQTEFPGVEVNKSANEPGKSHVQKASITVEYADLVAVLNSTVSMGLFKIELLPDSHPLESGLNVLVDGFTIAIPKKTLKNAFLSARQVFFDNLEHVKRFEQNQEAILDASAVLLLMMPEHLTAVNARKRIIMAWEKQSESKGRKRMVMDLWLLDSILWSRLNKHTKSPTLWSHRKWLIQRLPSPELLQMERTCSSLSLRREREVSMIALIAAEMHPRNYYAWGYLRWWINQYPDVLENFGSPITRSNMDLTPLGLPRLTNIILEWCLKHPSDISGWSFLIWLITRPGTCADGPLRLHGPFEPTTRTVLDRTRSLNLRNESVWVFLRTVMSSQDMPQDIRQAFIDHAESILASDSKRSQSQSIARAALEWVVMYRRNENGQEY
jgi:protein prenyltransferase alpha subunit repeat containing protein 1